jgi:hypothetical protein
MIILSYLDLNFLDDVIKKLFAIFYIQHKIVLFKINYNNY